MAKTVKVDGKLISVPDDATIDQINDLVHPIGDPNVNPSDAIPKVARPHVPGLDPEPDNFITSPNGLIRTGVRQVGRGIAAMTRPGLDAKLGAGSEIIRGGIRAATPAAIPFMAASPLVTAARLGLGAGAQYLGEKGSEAVGLGPGASHLIGDAAGLSTGGSSFMDKPSAVLSGAASGAKAALTDSIPITRYGHTLNLPKPLAGMAAGEAMGYGFRSISPHAPEIGAGIGAVAPVIKGAYEGGKTALSDYNAKGVPSPFNLHPDRTMPSSGGSPFNPRDTGIEGGGADLPGPSSIAHESDIPGGQSGSIKKQALKSVPTRNVSSKGNNNVIGGDPGDLSPSAANDTSTDLPGGQNPNIGSIKKQMMKRVSGLGKDTRGSVNLGRFGGSGSGEPATVPVAEAPTRPVQSPSEAGTSLPESAQAPSTRNVIYDEQNKPVAYDDPDNPYSGSGTIKPVTRTSNAYSDQSEGMIPGTEAPDHNMPQEEARTPKPLPSAADLHEQRTDAFRPKDVHDQIAMEGLQKRAADSRAKYEDVYNNVIKGQYSPDDLRNMTPELQTQIDMKIKNMKGDAGKKKYGTGLNPAVTESLAQRLEAEPSPPDQANQPQN